MIALDAEPKQRWEKLITGNRLQSEDLAHRCLLRSDYKDEFQHALDYLKGMLGDGVTAGLASSVMSMLTK